MRKTYLKGQDRKFNLDWIDDWAWLFGPEPVAEEVSWSELDILHICDCLLQDSIRSLFDPRVSTKTSIEIHQWIISEKDSSPFSFDNCCLLSGLDPDELRDTILGRLKRIDRTSH